MKMKCFPINCSHQIDRSKLVCNQCSIAWALVTLSNHLSFCYVTLKLYLKTSITICFGIFYIISQLIRLLYYKYLLVNGYDAAISKVHLIPKEKLFCVGYCLWNTYQWSEYVHRVDVDISKDLICPGFAAVMLVYSFYPMRIIIHIYSRTYTWKKYGCQKYLMS